MSLFKGASIKGFKQYMKESRVAQLLVLFALIAIGWVAYVQVSSLLSTFRSQSLLEAIAVTAGKEEQLIEIAASADSQATTMGLKGLLHIRNNTDINVEAEIKVSQVDQDEVKVDLVGTSTKDGQYVKFGDLSTAVERLGRDADESSVNTLTALSERLSGSWLKLGDVGSQCYEGMVAELGDRDSELRRVATSAYMKSPLMHVSSITTLADGGRQYNLIPTMSNAKNFARDIKDSKVLNKIDGCKGGKTIFDNYATAAQSDIDNLRKSEAASTGPSFAVIVKDGEVAEVKTLQSSQPGVQTVQSASLVFKSADKDYKFVKPDLDKVVNLDDMQGDIQKLITDSLQAVQQQQQQPVNPYSM